MIRPKRPPRKSKQYQYSTADIENNPETGEMVSMGLYYKDASGEKYYTFSTIDAFLDFVVSNSDDIKSLREIWAHNGANYDWLYVPFYIATKKKNITFRMLMSGSQSIGIRLYFPGKDYCIHLLDTLRLMPVSLDKLSKDLGVSTKKLDIHDVLPHELYQTHPDLYEKYLRNDVIATYEILGKFIEIINENILQDTPIYKPSMTLASQAMTIFKLKYLHKNIYTTKNKRVKEYERKSYHGGLVFAPEKGIYPDTMGVDVNSMYPWAMTEQEVPTSYRGKWVRKYQPGKIGIYKVEFKLAKDQLKFIFDETGKQASEGIAYITNVDCELIQKTGGTFRVIDGFIYLRTEKLLEEYARDLYVLKNWGKQTGRTAVERIAKLLLNSLYGKFGQGDYVMTCRTLSKEDYLRRVKNGEKVYAKGPFFFVEEYQPSNNTFVAIASLITARARYRLVTSILDNSNRLVLADTDSMVMVGPIKNIDMGSKLGQWSLEFENCETTIIGRKMYAVMDKEKHIKTRSKGVKVNSKNEDSVVNSMKAIVEGKLDSQSFRYISPPTPREVVSGRTPGKWIPRTRTIRATDDTTRIGY